MKPGLKKTLIQSVGLIIILVAVNWLASFWYARFDLTKEKRFSLAESTEKMLKDVDDIVYIKVYLKGEFPAGFKRLQGAAQDLLSDFNAINSNIQFDFIDPYADSDPETQRAFQKELAEQGIVGTQLRVQSGDGFEERLIFPAATVNYKSREMTINLLEQQIGFTPEQTLNNSVILLEYKLANAISKLQLNQQIKVGFTEGHGELPTFNVGALGVGLEELRYLISKVDLPNVAMVPSTLDALIVANPTRRFSEKDKYKIDQFVMRGGKVIWLLDGVNASLDSLQRAPAFVALERDLNLEDLLFKYGVRINNTIVQDMAMCNPIPIRVGEIGGQPQMQLFPWFFHPLLRGNLDHPISRNLPPVASYFPSSIDTISVPNQKKTILLSSGNYSKVLRTPGVVSLEAVRNEPNPDRFKQQNLPVAVLVEGDFTSVFKNRLASSFLEATDSLSNMAFKESVADNKMLVIADGDIIKNEVSPQGGVLDLGFYKFTKQTFANKTFLLNAIEYLLDDKGIIETRTKEIQLRPLDMPKVKAEKLKWQVINLVAPIILVIAFALGYTFYRRRKYAV